jgi:hypothetical protein
MLLSSGLCCGNWSRAWVVGGLAVTLGDFPVIRAGGRRTTRAFSGAGIGAEFRLASDGGRDYLRALQLYYNLGAVFLIVSKQEYKVLTNELGDELDKRPWRKALSYT